MHPFTFLACTYNLWGTERWEERSDPPKRFLAVNQPDVLCVQELRQVSRDLIEATLPSIRSVDDPLPGWTEEGNIFWNSDLFDLVEYGAWMMHRGPIRPTLTSVVDFYVAEKAPSDHKPILTTYVLEDR